MLLLHLLSTTNSVSTRVFKPRSRNLVAYQDKNWETYLSGGGTSNDPSPEDCPHCLNRGGILAQCGISSGMTNGVPLLRNYDSPLNIEGNDMLPNIQGVYKEGSIITIDVLVTTHHKGHFEFAICPIHDNVAPMEIPTEECFSRNKLQFVSDELSEGVKWLHRAVEAGCGEAASDLGECYAEGDGVEQDIEKAMKYSQKAAEFDFIPAFFMIGSLHMSIGEVEEAMLNYRKAAICGLSEDWLFDRLRAGFKSGYITKDEYAFTLRENQAASNEMKSVARERFKEFMKRNRRRS